MSVKHRAKRTPTLTQAQRYQQPNSLPAKRMSLRQRLRVQQAHEQQAQETILLLLTRIKVLEAANAPH